MKRPISRNNIDNVVPSVGAGRQWCRLVLLVLATAAASVQAQPDDTEAAVVSGGGRGGGAIPKPTSEDRIFSEIERYQYASGRPFGRVLDAGTGEHSLRFVRSLRSDVVDHDLGVSEWTAVTASKGLSKSLVRKLKRKSNTPQEQDTSDVFDYVERLRETGDDCRGVVLGNWNSSETCASVSPSTGDGFDTVLVDYLLGSLEPAAPYFHNRIFDRLSKTMVPGGRMYVVSLEPIPDRGTGKKEIIAKMRHIRDACLFLAGEKLFREYPLTWTVRALEKAGLKVVDTHKFDRSYTKYQIIDQLEICLKLKDRMPSEGVADEVHSYVKSMSKAVVGELKRSPEGIMTSGFDYLVVAEKPLLEEE